MSIRLKDTIYDLVEISNESRALETNPNGNIRLYAHYNNEINFGGGDETSVIYFGYRKVDAKPIPTSFIFGESTGTATVTASGFKKKDSSDSYVLLGGGGSKLISDFSLAHSHPYLPTAGGTMTGSFSIKETTNILLRPNNSGYTSGIGYDTSGNECISIWAKNTVTRFRWHAGIDMSSLAAGTMMGITPDFEISKADGSAKGYIAGKQILTSSNYSTWAATSDHNHNSSYVTALSTSGDNVTWTKNGSSNSITVPFSTETKKFKRVSNGANPTDLNTCLSGGGIAYNYGAPAYWSNGPSGMSYGQVLQYCSGTNNNLSGQLAWDVVHNSTTDTTGKLWWRASDDGTWTEAKWHQIAYTDSDISGKAATAGTADVATIARSLGTNNTIKMYVQNNDEINFGGTPSNGSTTIYVGYRSVDSRTVPTSYVFGGSDGTATVTANGFKKKGSSESYVLLGNGGHKAISDFATSGHTHTKSQITDFPTSMPASDVYSWAKAATKPSYNFGEIGAGIATIGDGTNQIYLRTNGNWASTIYHQSNADEAVVFLNAGKNVGSTNNYTTSWIFAYGTPANRPDWTTLTPAMQIKGNSVVINKLIGSKVGAEYNLDVNGSFNATSGYINKNAILHAGNTKITSGTITINGTNITPLTSLPSHDHTIYTLTSTRHDSDAPAPNSKNGLTFQFSYNIDSNWSNVLMMKSYSDNNYTCSQIITPAGNPGKDTGYSGDMKWRQGRNSTWLGWKTILDSNNYTAYTVTKTGTGASGTWGISISGNAATATSATSATKATTASSATTAGSADVATIARSLGTDNSIKAYAQYNNEFNFGGTNNSSAIYFGYRAVDSKPIPTAFVFGSSNGTATLTASGYKKKDSSDSYVLLGGGGHKAVSDFSMSHSHPYLPTAGGTMTGTIYFTDTAAACLTFGSITSSKLKGITLPTMGSNGIGLFSRYGKSTDEGGIILTEDTCLIYNSGDTGWQFQVHDKDLNQTDLSGTSGDGTGTRVFGTQQSDYCAWSRGGFIKSGSSNSYVLLGGGGHKAVSDFATSGHTHSQYLTSIPSHTHAYLPTEQVSQEQNSDAYTWIRGYALTDGKLRSHVYNTSGKEWSYWIGMSTSKAYGSIIRTSYNDGTPTIQVMGLYNGTWSSWRTCSFEGHTHSYAASSHTHNYAGSSSAGGAATSANKLNTNAGSATKPVYFTNGVPTACTYGFNGAYGMPVVLAAGYIYKNSYTSTTWAFSGSYCPALTGGITTSVSGGVLAVTWTAASGRSRYIYGAVANMRTSGAVTSYTGTEYKDRSLGMYWLGTATSTTTTYIRAMSQGDQNNDTGMSYDEMWGTSSEKSDHCILSFSIIVIGYWT